MVQLVQNGSKIGLELFENGLEWFKNGRECFKIVRNGSKLVQNGLNGLEWFKIGLECFNQSRRVHWFKNGLEWFKSKWPKMILKWFVIIQKNGLNDSKMVQNGSKWP